MTGRGVALRAPSLAHASGDDPVPRREPAVRPFVRPLAAARPVRPPPEPERDPPRPPDEPPAPPAPPRRPPRAGRASASGFGGPPSSRLPTRSPSGNGIAAPHFRQRPSSPFFATGPSSVSWRDPTGSTFVV